MEIIVVGKSLSKRIHSAEHISENPFRCSPTVPVSQPPDTMTAGDYNYLSREMKKKLQELPMKIDITETEEAEEYSGGI